MGLGMMGTGGDRFGSDWDERGWVSVSVPVQTSVPDKMPRNKMPPDKMPPDKLPREESATRTKCHKRVNVKD